MSSPAIPKGFDPTDPALIEERIPHEEFAALRKTAPVFWIEQEEDARSGMNGGNGFFAVSKHEHVKEVSRN
ncbi:MAG TPA: steroid C27-monooxygenase, partial [Nocardioidaceae bacterium]|nr:steroid C27-monooxygenase [Nocardioidaceae bacterium]